MGALVIKISKKNNLLISRLAKELGGKVISIDDEQFEDLALGNLMDNVKTGETVSRKNIIRNSKH